MVYELSLCNRTLFSPGCLIFFRWFTSLRHPTGTSTHMDTVVLLGPPSSFFHHTTRRTNAQESKDERRHRLSRPAVSNQQASRSRGQREDISQVRRRHPDSRKTLVLSRREGIFGGRQERHGCRGGAKAGGVTRGAGTTAARSVGCGRRHKPWSISDVRSAAYANKRRQSGFQVADVLHQRRPHPLLFQPSDGRDAMVRQLICAFFFLFFSSSRNSWDRRPLPRAPPAYDFG